MPKAPATPAPPAEPASYEAALEELEQLYDPLLEDFRHFYPQLQQFAKAAM